jgi:hypothetical protein
VEEVGSVPFVSLVRDVVNQIVRSALPSRLRGRRRPEPVLGPGQAGSYATTQAHDVGHVATSYNPSTDGDPDPGEIVWTWVPYEENDGRGKDRPVLVVAREPAGTVLAVQLSSQAHDDDVGWVPVGAGAWDGEGRPSWANLNRVLRVHEQGMRREAASLDREPFDRVVAGLRQRYGWD